MKHIRILPAALLVLFCLPLLSHAEATTSPTPTYTVTIDLYIDGKPATADALSANSASFPMNAWWSAKNIGVGKGDYPLSTVGFNSSNPYEAITSDMTQGADYNTRETISWNKGDVVSGSCRIGDPFTLVGYTWGDTLAEAAAGTPTTDAWPRFLNMTGNKYVIIWDQHCLTTPVNTSPTNGTVLTTATWAQATWTPITDPYGTVSYYYESSNTWQVNSNGSFVNPVYQSGPLSSASIPTPGTPVGTYYWHVKAVDSAGDSSWWSLPTTTKVKAAVVATVTNS